MAAKRAPKEPKGKLYTIEEWKAKFGEPGLATDVHGRMMGFFPTEPDFCEPHPDDEPLPPAA